MPDLKSLTPQALGAAMKTGTVEWGRWGSAEHHALYVQEIPKRTKGYRHCRCGCRKRATHAVMANGIALATGCEMQARRSKRRLEAPRARGPVPSDQRGS